MLLRDIMTRNVEEISPQATLTDAAQRMKSLDVGVLPVAENDNVVGMLTDRDIALRAVAEGRDPQHTQAREAMTPGVFYCYEDEDVKEAARVMEDKQIRRLLVFHRDKHVVGIVSLGDVATRLRSEKLGGEILERVSEPVSPPA